jgi:hypothetical protein
LAFFSIFNCYFFPCVVSGFFSIFNCYFFQVWVLHFKGSTFFISFYNRFNILLLYQIHVEI